MLFSLIPAEIGSGLHVQVTNNMLNNRHNLIKLLQIFAKNRNDLQVEVTRAERYSYAAIKLISS